MSLTIKHKDYPTEFGESLAVRNSIKNSSLSNISNHKFLLENFSTDSELNNSNNKINPNSNKFENKKDINTLTNNFKKIVDYLSEKKLINETSRKFYDETLNKLNSNLKNNLDKINSKEKELINQKEKQLLNRYSKQIEKLDLYIKNVENNPNSSDFKKSVCERKKEQLSNINLKIIENLETWKDEKLNPQLALKKEELYKKGIGKIEDTFLNRQNHDFEFLQNINKENHLNFYTNNIKKSDVGKFVNALEKVGNLSRDDIKKDVVKLLEGDGFKLPLQNYGVTRLKLWREENPNSNLGKKQNDYLKKEIREVIGGLVNGKIRKSLKDLEEIKEFNELVDRTLTECVNKFSSLDKQTKERTQLKQDLKETKQELKEAKKEIEKLKQPNKLDEALELLNSKTKSSKKPVLTQDDLIKQLTDSNNTTKINEIMEKVGSINNSDNKAVFDVLKANYSKETFLESVSIKRDSNNKIENVTINKDLESEIKKSDDYKKLIDGNELSEKGKNKNRGRD